MYVFSANKMWDKCSLCKRFIEKSEKQVQQYGETHKEY